MKIHLPSGDIQRAPLSFDQYGTTILSSSVQMESVDSDTTFSLIEPVESFNLPLLLEDQVFLKPSLGRHLNYSAEVIENERYYPPSTDNWTTHLVDKGTEAAFIVHRISNRDRLLLFIVNPENYALLSAHIIHPYEMSLLQLNADGSWDDDLSVMLSQKRT